MDRPGQIRPAEVEWVCLLETFHSVHARTLNGPESSWPADNKADRQHVSHVSQQKSIQ